MSTNNTKTERKKPKLVRDSFTMPKSEYAAIDVLKTRAIAQGRSVKKSELLRAGLFALQAMTDAQFKAAVAAVPQLKTGRPASEPEAKAEAPKAKPAAAAPRAARAPARKRVVAAAPAAPTAAPKAAPKAARKAVATKVQTKAPAQAAKVAKTPAARNVPATPKTPAVATPAA